MGRIILLLQFHMLSTLKVIAIIESFSNSRITDLFVKEVCTHGITSYVSSFFITSSALIKE